MPGTLVRRAWQHDPSIYAPAKYKRACAYQAFVPDRLRSLALSLDAETAGLVSEAEHAIHTLNTTGGRALDPLARLLLRTESIASSKVEGMQLGVPELARAEARSESGLSASESAREILANIDAMVLAVEDASVVERFGAEQIADIHVRLMAGALNARVAGTIRIEQNWIGGNDYNPCGAEFVPPPPEHVAPLLADLCEAMNDDRLPPLVQAALIHAQFETIHPFHDGNGRAGRALIHVVFKRRRLAPSYVPPISVVLAAERDRYIAGLTAFRGDGVTEWIEHFAGAAARAANLATAYVHAVNALRGEWRELLLASVAPRAGATAWSVIDILPAHPIITAPVATAATGRVKASVYQALEQLENAGVLIRLSASRRNQAWEASGLLDLIAGMDAGDLPPAPRVTGSARAAARRP